MRTECPQEQGARMSVGHGFLKSYRSEKITHISLSKSKFKTKTEQIKQRNCVASTKAMFER